MSDELAEAMGHIETLASALERIESIGCSRDAIHRYLTGDETRQWRCFGEDKVCCACVAHEAMATFRGR